MKLNDEKRVLIEGLKAKFGSVVTRKQILEFVKTSGTVFEGSRVPAGTEFPHWITNNKMIKVGRGAYNLDLLTAGPATVAAVAAANAAVEA